MRVPATNKVEIPIPGGALSPILETAPRWVGDTGPGGRGWEAPVGKRKTEVEILRGKVATVLGFTVKRVPFSCNVAHPCA